jgi:hypothetical protein
MHASNCQVQASCMGPSTADSCRRFERAVEHHIPQSPLLLGSCRTAILTARGDSVHSHPNDLKHYQSFITQVPHRTWHVHNPIELVVACRQCHTSTYSMASKGTMLMMTSTTPVPDSTHPQSNDPTRIMPRRQCWWF